MRQTICCYFFSYSFFFFFFFGYKALLIHKRTHLARSAKVEEEKATRSVQYESWRREREERRKETLDISLISPITVDVIGWWL